jgi:translocation and assembly module TamB
MIIFLRKTGIFVVRMTLALCALIFIMLIAIQLVLITGVNLVAAGHGSSFFERQVNNAFKDSGYNITFDALYYDPVRGFSVYNLSVSDQDGVFLTLDRFSVGAYLTFSSLRNIDIYARGGNLSLERLPQAHEEKIDQSETSLEPFHTPDIFFRTLTVSNLSFDTIELGNQVAGNEFIFAPSLVAQVILTDKIDFLIEMKPGLAAFAENIQAPQIIEARGNLTPSNLDFGIYNFIVSSNDYQLKANASGNIGKGGHIDLIAEATLYSMAALTADALDTAEAKMSITGPFAGPALTLSAVIVPRNLKERGLSDLHAVLETTNIAEGMKGHVRIETSYQNDPLTLESLLSYEAPELSLREIKGTAPEINIDGNGVLSSETMLFDGKLNLSANNLAHYAELVGTELSGKLVADITFKPSEAGQQSADVTAQLDKGVYDTFSMNSAKAKASFHSLENPWPHSAQTEISSLRIAESIKLNTLYADVKESGDARYKLSLKGNGNISSPISFDGSAMLSNLTQPIPDIDDIDMRLRNGASNLKISGDFDAETMDITLSAKNFSGQDIPASLPSQLEDMRIDLDATISGAPSKPLSNLTTTIRGLNSGAYKNASLTAKAQHDGKNIFIQLNGNGSGIRKLDGTATFPFSLSLRPFHYILNENAPLTGDINANIDLAAIANLFLPPTQSLAGNLVAHGKISGTLSIPKPVADIRILEGKFEDAANRLIIDKISVLSKVTEETISISTLSATDGKNGTIDGGGLIALDGSKTDAKVQVRNFNITQGDIANGFADADLSLSGSLADKMTASGKINIAEMQVVIPERFSSTIPQLNIVEDEKEKQPSFLENLLLDIHIDAHNRIFVRGWGLDAEFGGEVAISGTASKPQMNGDLSSIRGRFEEFGKRFTLEKANLRFQGDVPPSPYLDIEATTPAGDVTGSILLKGPVVSPSISFASTPSLPEDEVLSRILFGKDSARISPFQAIQLAQAIRRFSGEGSSGPGLDPLGMIRGATGLDDISVEMDDAGNANVGVGKYLSDNVYLELGAGKAENSGEATITIEVTPSINVESRIGQDAQGGGGVFWKHDY